jgi:pimeloyl-ACP methyl ester carboxylesterase
MRPCIFLVVLACWSGPASADEWYVPYITPQQQVHLDGGRKLNVYCLGSGTPTVMLEAGFSGSTLSWRKVQATIAETANARVCAYDRAGMGHSDRAPFPRTALAEVEDLEALLKRGNLPPPYVVVGASMGAMNMRLFVDRNRKDVVGMALIDPPIENQTSRMGASASKFRELDAAELARIRQCADDATAGKLRAGDKAQIACDYWGAPDWPKPLNDWWQHKVASADYQATLLSEAENTAMSDAQVERSRRAWGALPLIVLTSDEDITPIFGEQSAAVVDVWVKGQDAIARLSSIGVRRTVPESDHNIQISKPQAVVDAVVEVIKATR